MRTVQTSGMAFARADVHHAEAAEIAVLGAERAVDDIHVLRPVPGVRLLSEPR